MNPPKFLLDAEEVWKELEIPELFPRCCIICASALYPKGYTIVDGIVELDNYCNTGKPYKIRHIWNLDPESGMQFDITSELLNPHLSSSRKLPKIAFWNEGENPVYHAIRKGLKPCEVY